MIRFDVKARIALEADISQARSIIVKTLSKDEVVLKHPAPMATVAEVGEYGVFFIVRFWVAPLSVARIPIIKENINEKIKRALDEAGIWAPYPHMRLIMPDDGGIQIVSPSKKLGTAIDEQTDE